MTSMEGLRYLLVGDSRSGMLAVANVIDNHKQAACYIDLFSKEAQARKEAHETYFGKSRFGQPEWFCLGDEVLEGGHYSNPVEYLTHCLRDGKPGVSGICVPYGVIRRYELYETITEFAHRGDFCLLHMVRNPLECLVSQLQAEQTGVWRRFGRLRDKNAVYMPVQPKPPQVEQFIDEHVITRDKLLRCTSDSAEIYYVDFVRAFGHVCRRLFEFLELPTRKPVCRSRRLVTDPLRKRLSNMRFLEEKVSRTFRHYFEEAYS